MQRCSGWPRQLQQLTAGTLMLNIWYDITDRVTECQELGGDLISQDLNAVGTERLMEMEIRARKEVQKWCHSRPCISNVSANEEQNLTVFCESEIPCPPTVGHAKPGLHVGKAPPQYWWQYFPAGHFLPGWFCASSKMRQYLILGNVSHYYTDYVKRVQDSWTKTNSNQLIYKLNIKSHMFSDCFVIQ